MLVQIGFYVQNEVVLKYNTLYSNETGIKISVVITNPISILGFQ